MAKRRNHREQEPVWATTLRRLDRLKAHVNTDAVQKQRPIRGLRRESRALILHPVLMRELEIAAARKGVSVQRYLAIKLATEGHYDKDDI